MIVVGVGMMVPVEGKWPMPGADLQLHSQTMLGGFGTPGRGWLGTNKPSLEWGSFAYSKQNPATFCIPPPTQDSAALNIDVNTCVCVYIYIYIYTYVWERVL